jgi:hypothetical protein
VAAVRGRCKELVANDALSSNNIYLMEGEGMGRSNSMRIPQTPSVGPRGKTGMIPEVGKMVVATARRERVEQGVTLEPMPDSPFKIRAWARGLLSASWERESP